MLQQYQEYYLEGVMDTLGEMTDYAVYTCRMDPDTYWKLFIASGAAGQIENGNPVYLSAYSGIELFHEVMELVGDPQKMILPRLRYDYSPEYWAGWITAYYQWETKRRFRDIQEILPLSEVCEMYHPYHEMDERQFVEAAELIFQKRNTRTNLQRIRRLRGYSQRLLAARSGVNLRTLQQYETGAKDINKAAAASVAALAQVLGCEWKDLISSSVGKY